MMRDIPPFAGGNSLSYGLAFLAVSILAGLINITLVALPIIVLALIVFRHRDDAKMPPGGAETVVKYTAILGAFGVLFALVGHWLVFLPVAAIVFLLAFFRDPPRAPEGGEDSLISPADGKIADIGEADENLFVKRRCLKIGIFMSIFDVHVNKAPLAGRVEFIHYRRGEFLNALDKRSATENENNSIGLSCDEKGELRLLVRQIAGVIARRIVCAVRTDQVLVRGETLGMIKFGSRVEVYVPLDSGFEPRVSLGDRVEAGRSILGVLRGQKPARTE